MPVLISHRLPTVRIVDHFVVLDKSIIVEIDMEDELLWKGGRYAELFKLQVMVDF